MRVGQRGGRVARRRPRIPGSTGGGRTPRAPGLADSSKMIGSSQRAWWKRRGDGLGPTGRPALTTGPSLVVLMPSTSASAAASRSMSALRVDLGDADQGALAELGKLAREVLAAEDAALEQGAG